MFEIKITADSVSDLTRQVDELRRALPTTFVALAGPTDVPLPEPRAPESAEPPKRTRKPKEAEDLPSDPQSAAPAESAAEGQDSSQSPEPSDTSPKIQSNPTTTEAAGGATSASPSEHAAPGEVYLLAGDGYNNDKRRLTYKDGVRFSSVHKDSEHKFTEYAEHAPEVKADIGNPISSDDGIPEHMRDDVAPASVDAARLESLTEGVEPYQEGDEVPEDVLERPTETGSAQPAEPEPDTSETVTPASSDGAPPEEASGPSQPAASASPLDEYGDKLEACGAWADVLPVMRDFFASEFFRGLPTEKQNIIRGRTWDNLADMGNFPMPDPITDVSAFRLYIESATDPEAISGSFVYLQKGDRWKNLGDANRAMVEKAVAERLAALKG